ncbi:AMP-dependent synthetase/ligase [Penicillium atrosanguineum]|uniref:AMP-dependent synthetase/ligase n=1 Tax=Penicillium atrosanguineum TaxID=1132637 RepID=A0A9W9PZ05_9EURO|nr:AMP-dependent synthetase/ligase [Penicillium atrosanguineum]
MGIQRGDQTVSAASSSTTGPLVQKFGQLHVLDDLIRLRSSDAIQDPILAYPSSDKDAASYTYYTGQDLDEMINQAVTVLMNYGFQPSEDDGCTVALLTLSDLNMVITFFALSRLGYTIMMLSSRLSGEACVSLLDTVCCDTILYGNTGSIRSTIGEILQRKLMSCHPMPNASLDNTGSSILVLRRNRSSEAQRNKTVLILHSSGSTGTPKPLYLTHRALMTHPLRGTGMTSFNPLPWYHLHGLFTALQAIWMRKIAYMWNAALPLTADSVVSVLEAAQPESVAAVPYMLQLLVDNPRGIAALRRCKLVTYGGAPCPDELGDRLVREGVPFGGSFGLTEAGLVAESISRPQDDPFWNYLRFFDNIRQYIWMKPIGDSLYECVYLKGHPALTTSNSDEPPGSFHSKDVFTLHPTIPDRWKYASRLDDRITLVNGEKVLPLPIEGYIKQDTLIHEAVVVGLGKSAPGLLIFQSQEVDEADISQDEYVDSIWPTIEGANARAEGFSQIARDMIAILPFASKFPRTDKGSMIRAQVYLQYAELIDSIYINAEQSGGNLRLDIEGTQSCLMDICRESLGTSVSGVEADFFAEGFDSLKAIHLRRRILQTFSFEQGALCQNVVYETGSILRLAKYICALQNGETVASEETDIDMMKNLIQKYSSFRQHIPRSEVTPNANSVILTGATGSIGAHILYELLNDDSISTVFCLTRRSSPPEAIIRSLIGKDLFITAEQATRIIALNSSLNEPELGLGDEDLIRSMKGSVTQIIHAAWPVNFNLSLAQFEPHIRGLHNLIQFSLSVQRPVPATLIFCSSISTALASPSTEIQDEPMRLESAYMGYGQSKLIGEHIVSVARASGARAFSLRIGQVSGHSKKGLWNDSEALPLLIRSVLTLKALPEMDEICSWLPVDKLASTIIDLTRTCSAPGDDLTEGHTSRYTKTGADDSIYNVCNSREFSWSALLKSLARSGFHFETVSLQKWLDMLRESEGREEEDVNPAVKLIGHYEAMYGGKSSGSRLGPKVFTTDKAERDSVTLRNDRLRIIEDGILDCYARDWLSRWVTPQAHE